MVFWDSKDEEEFQMLKVARLLSRFNAGERGRKYKFILPEGGTYIAEVVFKDYSPNVYFYFLIINSRDRLWITCLGWRGKQVGELTPSYKMITELLETGIIPSVKTYNILKRLIKIYWRMGRTIPIEWEIESAKIRKIDDYTTLYNLILRFKENGILCVA